MTDKGILIQQIRTASPSIRTQLQRIVSRFNDFRFSVLILGEDLIEPWLAIQIFVAIEHGWREFGPPFDRNDVPIIAAHVRDSSTLLPEALERYRKEYKREKDRLHAKLRELDAREVAVEQLFCSREQESKLADRWQGRLELDPSISVDSPVVKGTWVTVSHLISLIVDGWTWSDILRVHPELTEDDIRTCLAYTVEEAAA